MSRSCSLVTTPMSLLLRLRGRKNPRVERGERNEGGAVGWKAHGADHLPAVQPQVHDLCERLLQHGG